MVFKVEPSDLQVIIRFGAGLNTRSSPDQINPIECTDGVNFDLTFGNTRYRQRAPFKLAGTATNGLPVLGYAQLERDNMLTTLIQAGGQVYQWDGASTFTPVGMVNSAARLRGTKGEFVLDNYTIITDVSLNQQVMQWDGTTLSDFDHNLPNAFFAKYIRIENERAIFANVKSGTATPHLLVGSQRSNPKILSLSDRPSSALSPEDPFFIPMPDLRPINGLEEAFGVHVVSTERGQFYKLEGSSAEDFNMKDLYPGSAAVGEEAVTFIGNDIAYGRQGAIERLASVEKAADVEADDMTREIFNLVDKVEDWILEYSSRKKKVYCFAPSQSRVYVLHKSFVETIGTGVNAKVAGVSPWSVWTTANALAFQPTAVMKLRRPSDGLETVYMGGPDGKIYELDEGTGNDDGSAITTDRLSQLYAVPNGARAGEVKGWVEYVKSSDSTLTLTFETEGLSRTDEPITITIERTPAGPLYGGGDYYGDGEYYGAKFRDRLGRYPFSIALPGETSHFRVRAAGSAAFEIHEIGLQFTAS